MPDSEFVPLSSYGGMSGGSCFRVYFPENHDGKVEPIRFHLLGVAFYETKSEDIAAKQVANNIICMRGRQERPSAAEKLSLNLTCSSPTRSRFEWNKFVLITRNFHLKESDW